jgi:hypothetical protein
MKPSDRDRRLRIVGDAVRRGSPALQGLRLLSAELPEVADSKRWSAVLARGQGRITGIRSTSRAENSANRSYRLSPTNGNRDVSVLGKPLCNKRSSNHGLRRLLHGHEGETPATAKELPTDHRASSRPYRARWGWPNVILSLAALIPAGCLTDQRRVALPLPD